MHLTADGAQVIVKCRTMNQSMKVRSSLYNERIDFRPRKEEPGGSVLLLCTSNEESSQ
jgi:hypothetical protein